MESQVYALYSTDCWTFMGKFLMGVYLQGLGTQSECVSYHVTVWGLQTYPFILCFGVLDYNSAKFLLGELVPFCHLLIRNV